MNFRRVCFIFIFSVLTTACAQSSARNENWTRSFPGFRAMSNLYGVGSYDLSVFLITSNAGHILINTGLEDSTAQIRENIESLGFRLDDVKILLPQQAHWGHTAALTDIKLLTGAEVWATPDDARVLEDGGFSDPHFGGRESFKPVGVDKIINDGDLVELGNIRHTVHGHVCRS